MDKEIRLEQKNKELIGKIKFNEKSRRKMQQSLMKQINDLKQQCKKQKEIIDKARKYINENVYEEDNGCGDYWWEIADKDELLKILEDKEVSE